ncbi:Transmembrane protein, partial [Cucurbita argyrosperma subsp. argyrosperma]
LIVHLVADSRVSVNLLICCRDQASEVATGKMGEVVPIYYSIIAFICTVGAIALAVFHIYRHLLNYTEPTYQRYIVRIIFMVPVYALMSFLSLVLPSSSIYFNSIREV